MQATTVQSSSEWRSLGEAFSFVLIAPLLLFLLFVVVDRSFHGPKWSVFLLFTLCGMSQFTALVKLRKSVGWKSNWARFGRYLLVILSFVLLFAFGEWSVIAGYYLLHPNAPPMFGP